MLSVFLNFILKKIYEFLKEVQKNKKSEKERFDKIEVKINQIVNKTAFNGIKINNIILDKKCTELHGRIYQIKNEFQFSYNILQPELLEEQALYLKKNNYIVLESVRKTIKLLRKTDVVCYKFHELNSMIRDLNTLLLLKSRLGGVHYVNPYFLGFGTITSRIIVREPSLQNLKKENRNIIIPNIDKELFYIDYSQFEASILAHLSSDKKLLYLINNKDIYGDIVLKVFNENINEENRKKAKILFYRYLYGDSFESDKDLKSKVNNYFERFETLNKFKRELIEKSIKQGFVETNNGNCRLLDINNENIWILSHLVQSTASYIFKMAIIKTFDLVKNAKLLLPLHDGALYEINADESTKIKNSIIEIFEDVFRSECDTLENVTANECNFY